MNRAAKRKSSEGAKKQDRVSQQHHFSSAISFRQGAPNTSAETKTQKIVGDAQLHTAFRGTKVARDIWKLGTDTSTSMQALIKANTKTQGRYLGLSMSDTM